MLDIKASVLVNNMQYRFCKEFFAVNATGIGKCSACGRDGLNRYERVDTEFFNPESFCIKCWIKEVYEDIH